MNASLIEAFPNKLSADVSRLAAVLDPDVGLATSEPFTVTCEGEAIHIPHRIYRPLISDTAFGALSSYDKLIAACWFTRHHDGYVRERFLRALPTFDRSWVVAYVVTLCGEYIAELLDYIWAHRALFDQQVLSLWLRENDGFYARVRSRIVSYWNCYYRGQHPLFSSYVGSQILVFFDQCAASHHGPTSPPP